MTSAPATGELERLLEEEARLEQMLNTAKQDAERAVAAARANAAEQQSRIDAQVAAAVAARREQMADERRQLLASIETSSAQRLLRYREAGEDQIRALAEWVAGQVCGAAA